MSIGLVLLYDTLNLDFEYNASQIKKYFVKLKFL